MKSLVFRIHAAGDSILRAFIGIFRRVFHTELLYVAVLGFLIFFPAQGCTSQTSNRENVQWEGRKEVKEGAGYRGPWKMNDSEFHYVDDPTAAIRENGEVGIGWVNQSRKNIYFQRIRSDGSRRFDRPVNVSKSPDTFSWLPDLVMAPAASVSGDSAHVYLFWQEIVFSGGSHGGEAFFARSTDGGRSFNEPVNLSNSIAGDGKGRLTKRFWHNGSLDLVRGPGGALYTAWTEYEGKLWISRSTNEGKSFSDPIHVAGNYNKPARGPSLAIDSAGTVYVIWVYGEKPQADLHLAVSNDGTRSFSEPLSVIQNTGHIDAPKIAVGEKERLHVVYGVSTSGPFETYEIRYARSSSDSIEFGDPKKLSNPKGLTFDMGHFPSIRYGDEGKVYLVWELYKDPGARPTALAFTYSANNGKSFDSPVVIPGSNDSALGFNGSQQGYLLDKLAVNNRGEIVVVNSTFTRGRKSHIWLFRGRLMFKTDR